MRPKLQKYVCGRMLAVRCLGLYVTTDRRIWRMYSPVGLRLSVWIRAEPMNGRGRCKNWYDAGGSCWRTALRGRGAKQRAAAQEYASNGLPFTTRQRTTALARA